MDICTVVALKDKPGRSPTNRSLERGVEILRAFRPGSEFLTNSDIAERAGLARSTVSRLTQTLVGTGMLQLDARRRAYRLAPAILSLAHAMKSGSTLLDIAAPKMRALAERERINVGLAAPDRDEMVYLESIRYSRRVVWRNVVSGQRVPMELTSLGRAYLATVPETRRAALYEIFERRRGAQWKELVADIEQARRQLQSNGFCAASWQPEVVALSSPLLAGDVTYVLNVSVLSIEPMDLMVSKLSGLLLGLLKEVQSSVDARTLDDIAY